MKNLKSIAIATVALGLSAFTLQNSVKWKIESNHSIKFSGTDVEGIFKTIDGDITFDKVNLNSSVANFEIDVNSINTGNGMKNKHAISAKWFDAETYPKIKFTSKQFSGKDNNFNATGTMEIHGVKKKITIPFTFTDNTFKSTFSVNRLDYGVGTMKGMSKKVSNEINLDVTIPVNTLK